MINVNCQLSIVQGETNQTSLNHTSEIISYAKKLFQNRMAKPGV